MHFWTVSLYELNYINGTLTTESKHLVERKDAEEYYQSARRTMIKNHPGAVVKEENYGGPRGDNLATMLNSPNEGALIAEIKLSDDAMLDTLAEEAREP